MSVILCSAGVRIQLPILRIQKLHPPTHPKWQFDLYTASPASYCDGKLTAFACAGVLAWRVLVWIVDADGDCGGAVISSMRTFRRQSVVISARIVPPPPSLLRNFRGWSLKRPLCNMWRALFPKYINSLCSLNHIPNKFHSLPLLLAPIIKSNQTKSNQYDHKIRFWEAPSGICSRTLRFPDSQVNCLSITPDKQFVAAAGNPLVRLFEINSTNHSPVLTCEGHTGSVTGLGFQREGRWMFTGSEDGTVKIWDLRSPGFQRSFSCGCEVNSVALHPNQCEVSSCDAR